MTRQISRLVPKLSIRAILGVLAATLLLGASAADAAPLRNKDVIKMVQAGLDTEIIIGTIESQERAFDLDPDSLIQLKEAGVSADVIGAMVKSAEAGTPKKATRAAAPPRAPVAREVLMQEGTEIRVRLQNTITSKDARAEDRLSFVVIDDVEVDGVVVIKRDAHGTGRITEATKGKSFGRKGKLNFSIDWIEAIDGTNIPVRTEQRVQGDSKVGTAVVVTYLAGPFGLLVKGKQAEVPAGTEFTVFSASDRKVKL